MKRFPLVSLRLGLMVLLGAMALSLSGCATDDPDNLSARPWNTPKTWENGLPSGLYEGR